MNDCSPNRKAFVTAVATWLVTPESDKKPDPPQLLSFGLCRACALDFFCQIAELNMAYSRDVSELALTVNDEPEVQKAVFKH